MSEVSKTSISKQHYNKHLEDWSKCDKTRDLLSPLRKREFFEEKWGENIEE